ncbi:MAG: class I SAM-dependent methyltransferase, partial [Solirubrobacteraceae bacterium]
RLLDLGCGTGNAALLAAERGAAVTGVDPADRLLEVASRRLSERDLKGRFVAGEAGALPFADGEFDVATSVFGVIFAPDADRAASELGRVCSVPARIVMTAWLPGGALAEAMRMRGEALTRIGGESPGQRFAWHDRAQVAALLEPRGFSVHVSEHELPFVASSAADFVATELSTHPMWVAARPALEAAGEFERLSEWLLAHFEDVNEDPETFRITSRYVVITARR